MIITQASLDALRTELSLVYKDAYDGAPVCYPELCTELPSSTRSNTYGWLAKQARLREWVGARVAQNLSERVSTIINKPFEGTVEVDRFDIEDDVLGIYKAQAVPDLAESARKHPDLLLSYLLFTNPTGFDGKALFAHDHPTFAKNPSLPQSYDNDYSLELTPDNFNTIWSAMASYRGEDGRPLAVLPNKLVVAPQLRQRAEQICNSSTTAQIIMNVAKNQNVAAASIDNVLKGWAEPLVWPDLSMMPNTWYLACTLKAIKPFVHQVRTPAKFVARFDPSDPKVFDQHIYTFGVESRGNVGATLPFLIARSNPGDSAVTIDLTA